MRIRPRPITRRCRRRCGPASPKWGWSVRPRGVRNDDLARGRFCLEEFREALPPVIFFLIGFNLIELTTRLFLADYMARLANYMIATTMALIVGKAVLVADVLPFMRR